MVRIISKLHDVYDWHVSSAVIHCDIKHAIHGSIDVWCVITLIYGRIGGRGNQSVARAENGAVTPHPLPERAPGSPTGLPSREGGGFGRWNKLER